MRAGACACGFVRACGVSACVYMCVFVWLVRDTEIVHCARVRGQGQSGAEKVQPTMTHHCSVDLDLHPNGRAWISFSDDRHDSRLWDVVLLRR